MRLITLVARLILCEKKLRKLLIDLDIVRMRLCVTLIVVKLALLYLLH